MKVKTNLFAYSIMKYDNDNLIIDKAKIQWNENFARKALHSVIFFSENE